MRILYYISFKDVVFLRCLRNLKSGPVLKKLGKMSKNRQKWAKIAVPESANIHYYYCSSSISIYIHVELNWRSPMLEMIKINNTM